jgi:hypothetical protein
MDEARRKQILLLALRDLRGTIDEVLEDNALTAEERKEFEIDLAHTEELLKDLEVS